MKLTRCRDDARTFAEGECRKPPRDELVRVLAERDVFRCIADQSCEACPYAGRLPGGALPLVVDEFRGVKPGTLLRIEADIRPSLMRVTGEENALGHAEPRVVRGERRGQRWLRISHKSGKNGLSSVVARYAAPLDPPVPRLLPIVRWTIFT